MTLIGIYESRGQSDNTARKSRGFPKVIAESPRQEEAKREKENNGGSETYRWIRDGQHKEGGHKRQPRGAGERAGHPRKS